MSDSLPQTEATALQPYTIWAGTTTFAKDGAPVLGSSGASMQRVIVMDVPTFKRLVKEHPSLATAKFLVGGLDG
jgi:hypothetical protein